MGDESTMDKLKRSIQDKACLKQDVFAVTKSTFEELRIQLAALTNDIHDFITPSDRRILVELKSTGAYEALITMAGDTVVFHMHTNVFTFPPSHPIHKSPYVSKNPDNAYCGIINIYNFLTDSYRFNRLNDSGYLVGRIFVNREGHFFVEGQSKLGFLFKDFSNSLLDAEAVRSVLETALLHVIEFDLYTPPYQQVKEVSLNDVQTLSQDLRIKTGKRLGFRFSTDDESVTF